MAVSGIVGSRVNRNGPSERSGSQYAPVAPLVVTGFGFCLSILYGMHEPVQKLTHPVSVAVWSVSFCEVKASL